MARDQRIDGLAQRLLIVPPEYRVTKKPLLAGFKFSEGKKKKKKLNFIALTL